MARLAGPALILLLVVPTWASAADSATGEAIYRDKCASCHGASGEGVPDEYPQPLTGELTPGRLAKLIAKTMPADEPGTCTGEDAKQVAAYVHEAFYSTDAQARKNPPRIEPARLTNRQYRNALADIVGSFRPTATWDDKRGLRGEYFAARGFRGDARKIDRLDPTVVFDFGTDPPQTDGFKPHEFSIRWSGSVLAPETGEYEFVVHTEHALRLFVNDDRTALIDGWVKSGDDTVHKATIRLLGGRAYPIRLEFSKAKQGVDDSKKGKTPPPVKATVRLEWKPPHRTPETIPARNLSPNHFPEVFVVATPFPPDDRSFGYERGTSLSRAWDAAATDAAIETAAYVGEHLGRLAGSRDDANKVREFAAKFVEQAFRRPLTDEQRKLYVDRRFDGAPDLETGLKRVVLLALKSPRFLFREPPYGGDANDVAARVSFALWDSIPDRELREAAVSGRLTNPDELDKQVRRMLPDLRTRSKLLDFFHQWLRIDGYPELAKDSGLFPGFDAAVASDLRTSLDLLLEDVVLNDPSDFQRLLTGDETFLNGRLAAFYGVDLPPDADFQKVLVEPNERAGVLTHPYILSVFAYTAASSPIHRGVFLSRNVLGRTLRPPPVAVAPLAPDLHPGLTTRERTILQTSPKECVRCHGMINPLGYALERFDAVGRYRREEKGKTVDAGGEYETLAGEVAKFEGARPMAAFLAGSDEVHAAFVDRLFHYLVKQPIRSYGPTAQSDLRRAFAEKGFSIRELTVRIACAAARPPESPPAPTAVAAIPPSVSNPPELPADPFAGGGHTVR